MTKYGNLRKWHDNVMTKYGFVRKYGYLRKSSTELYVSTETYVGGTLLVRYYTS